MVGRARGHGRLHRGRGEENGRRWRGGMEKGRKGDLLERASRCPRFSHPSRTDNLRSPQP